MSISKKPRADSKLKNLPDHIQEGFWLLLHPTDAETPAWSLEDLGGEIHEKHGISVALSTLSEWHSWYALRRRMENAAARANQTALELAKNSDLSSEDIDRVAQTVFTAESLEAGDIKAYVQLAKLRLQGKALALDSRKLALLEAKAAMADEAAGVVGDKALTPEEKAAELKRIFRMG